MSRLSLFFFCLFLSPAIKAQSDGAPAFAKKPFVIGEQLSFPSKILGENRTLNVYLPPDYSPDSSQTYHVIYLLDGSADEDFVHVAGLVQFCTFPWVAYLPPAIVVGIGNTDRPRDFTFPSGIEAEKKRFPTMGGSARFMDFIEKELQPFIDAQYKTNSRRTLIGQSLGGLLATELLLKRPRLFDRYIIISPSIWWDNGSILSFEAAGILAEDYPVATEIYIGVGKEGLAPSATPHVMEVDANLLAEKLRAAKSKRVRLHFDYLPDENHATIGHQSLINAFKLIFKP